MKKSLLLLSLCLTVTIGSRAQQSDLLNVKETTLSNGMTVWLNEDHTQPKIYGAVVVKAGAKDCPGTGIAHYFEHIMFKGNERMGTTDYAAERVWLDSISAQYDLLAQTKDDSLRSTIQKKINELSLKAADYAIPNEFNRLISKYGGSNLNAATGMDVTFYHNTFLPQFIEQWCWLNSERMINPVFRLFQAELENVYEEKNRSEDAVGGAMDKALKAVFKDHPYAEPIIGTTESLKNPRLSEMAAFYKKYYVAQNMGLVLCGDIAADSLQPLLERTFGRIPKGNDAKRNIVAMPQIEPATVPIKLPIPIVKAEALVFNGPTDYEKDAVILEVCNKMLTNGKAGMLDSLMNEHELLASMALRTAFNDAGVQVLAVIPKIFGSMKKAEKKCFEQIERLKQGNFSDELLQQVKKNMLIEAEQQLETIDSRSDLMVDVFSQGHKWQEVLAQLDELKAIGRDDIVRVANKYFTDRYLRLQKKFGISEKETLKQPGYKPIEPKNCDAKSAFAQQLEQLPNSSQALRLIDMERDAKRSRLAQGVTLYTTENPVNDIFTFKMRFLNGSKQTPVLEQLCDYLTLIGTDSLNKQQLESAWQRIGVDMEIIPGDETTTFSLTGREEQLEESLRLLNHFLTHAKGDKKSLSELKKNNKVNHSSFGKTKDDVMPVMLEYVLYGEQSKKRTQLSVKEVNKLDMEQLDKVFHELQENEVELFYCGRQATDVVARLSSELLSTAGKRNPRTEPYRRMKGYDENTVFFYHVPKSRQNFVLSYEQLAPASTAEQRAVAQLWAQYMGGGMSSVIFQNIREFRSLAYSTQGIIRMPSLPRHGADSLCFVSVAGTQADKTNQAMATLDSLLQKMPMKTENLEAARQEVLNDIQNSYPSFRNVATTIANLRLEGYEHHPDQAIAEKTTEVSAQQIMDYHRQHVADNKRVWIVIGDRKQTDFNELSRYGKVIELKKKDIFK